MKKIIFVFALILTATMVSCGKKAAPTSEEVVADSVEVVDTVVVDSIVADTVVADTTVVAE